jgi:hypothetical protein
MIGDTQGHFQGRFWGVAEFDQEENENVRYVVKNRPRSGLSSDLYFPTL